MTKEIQPVSPNLPRPKKGMPEWATDYLEALNKTEGVLTKAAELIGKDYSTTYKARLNFPDFAKAVDEIKAEWDSKHLALLDEVSLTQAMKPGCVTARIFRMKAYDPKVPRFEDCARPWQHSDYSRPSYRTWDGHGQSAGGR